MANNRLNAMVCCSLLTLSVGLLLVVGSVDGFVTDEALAAAWKSNLHTEVHKSEGHMKVKNVTKINTNKESTKVVHATHKVHHVDGEVHIPSEVYSAVRIPISSANVSSQQSSSHSNTTHTAATPNTSALILIHDVIKKVTDMPSTPQVTHSAQQYFKLFQHFLQQAIEEIIGGDEEEEEEPDQQQPEAKPQGKPQSEVPCSASASMSSPTSATTASSASASPTSSTSPAAAPAATAAAPAASSMQTAQPSPATSAALPANPGPDTSKDETATSTTTTTTTATATGATTEKSRHLIDSNIEHSNEILAFA